MISSIKAKLLDSKKSSGFTIVELLIVIVVIGILATLVIVTFTGQQQKARDAQRRTDINAIASHVSAYYADKGYYPTAADLNNATWRSNNAKGFDPEALKDPKATGGDIGTAAATGNQYGYVVTGCTTADPSSDANACTGYTLTAHLEADGSTYTKQSN